MIRTANSGATNRPNPFSTWAQPITVRTVAGPCQTLWNPTMIAPKLRRTKPSRNAPAVPYLARVWK